MKTLAVCVLLALAAVAAVDARHHRHHGSHEDRRWNGIMMGGPGSGKGTHGKLLAEAFNLCHISYGDLARNDDDSHSEVHKLYKARRKKDRLPKAPHLSDLAAVLIRSEKCDKGFIMDGKPRKMEHIDEFENMLYDNEVKLNAVIYLDAPDELLVQRQVGRLTHIPSGRSYHEIFRPPKVPGRDDVTGEPLTKRSTDNESDAWERVRHFRHKTEPLLEYYERLGILYRIDASRKLKDIQKAVQDVVRRTQ